MQKSAMRAKTQAENEKYTFRTWLLRLGMIGDEFKTARTHLLKNLEGNIAWRDPAQAEAQKQRLAQKRQQALEQEEQAEIPNIQKFNHSRMKNKQNKLKKKMRKTHLIYQCKRKEKNYEARKTIICCIWQ